MSHNPGCKYSGVDCETGCDCEGLERDETGFWTYTPCNYYEPRRTARDYAYEEEADYEIDGPNDPWLP